MKLNKIYYVPGLISLIGLPTLLFMWKPKPSAKKDYRVVKLNISSSQKTYCGLVDYTDDYIKDEISRKNKISVKLQGLHCREASLSYGSDFNSINKKIREFYLKGDTSSVLDIQLSECNVYGDFVWLCNEMLIHNVNRYVYLDNHFYVFAKYELAPDSPELKRSRPLYI